MAEVILNNDNFKAEVLDAKGLVLVDFWATWCGPCKMLAPTVSEIADEYEGKVKVCKLDVDQAMDIAMSYGVASIPTLILFKDGEIVTNGGRVLGVTALGDTLKEARANAYKAVDWVDFDNKYYRHDIGKAIDEA